METENNYQNINELIEGSKFFYKLKKEQCDIFLKYLCVENNYTVEFIEGFIELINKEPKNRGGKFSKFGYLVKRLYLTREIVRTGLVKELITEIQIEKRRKEKIRTIRQKVIEFIKYNYFYFDQNKIENLLKNKNIKKIVKMLLIHNHTDNDEVCLIEYDDTIYKNILKILIEMNETIEKSENECENISEDEIDEIDEIELDELEYWCHYDGIYRVSYQHTFY